WPGSSTTFPLGPAQAGCPIAGPSAQVRSGAAFSGGSGIIGGALLHPPRSTMNRDFVPPSLAELLTRYLHQQAAAHAEGLTVAATGEVVPHEAAPVQPVDPRLAWEEALTAAGCFVPGHSSAVAVLPDWSALVAAREPETGLPFCVGNFPQ